MPESDSEITPEGSISLLFLLEVPAPGLSIPDSLRMDCALEA